MFKLRDLYNTRSLQRCRFGLLSLRVRHRVVLPVDTNVSEKYSASIFNIEVNIVMDLVRYKGSLPFYHISYPTHFQPEDGSNTYFLNVGMELQLWRLE
jgi:hypothetical protein